MKVFVALLLLIAALAISYFLFFAPLAEPTEPKMRLKAESQVRLLGHVVFSLSLDTNLLPAWHGQANTGELDNRAIYEILRAKNNGFQDSPAAEWAKNGRFTDPWGHDYRFLFERNPADVLKLSGKLTIRSIGPNGVDDRGRGDDITSEVVHIGQ